MKSVCLFCVILFVLSCKFPDTDTRYKENENTTYQLHLSPDLGSIYYYDIQSESRFKIEVEEKEVNNINRSKFGVYYTIKKDSARNLNLQMQYDKINIYYKNGEEERTMDAANAEYSINPTEKMLGVLKASNLTAILSTSGEVKEVKGYKELGAKLMEGLDPNDLYSRKMAQSQWDQFVGNKLINNSLNQLFTMFPDSAVRIGDKWKTISRQEGEFGLNVKTFYRLKDIEDSVAIIESKGELLSDSATTRLMGYDVLAKLKGNIEGAYKVSMKTGMLISSDVRSKLKGNIQMMGREVPVEIENTLNVKGRKIGL